MFILETQGSQISLRNASLDTLPPRTSTKRGKIIDYSPASRRRAIDLFSRLEYVGHQCKFLTLTYSGIPAYERAKRDLRTFIKRLLRRFPSVSAVWRAELQKRGAAHFHLIIFDMPFVYQAVLRAMWMSCTQEVHSGVFIQALNGSRQVMYYCSKYIAKMPKVSDENSLLVNASYLTATPKWMGRHWGICNAKKLPFAPRHVALIGSEDLASQFSLAITITTNGRAGTCPVFQRFFTDKAYSLFLSLVRRDLSARQTTTVTADDLREHSRAQKKRLAAAFVGRRARARSGAALVERSGTSHLAPHFTFARVRPTTHLAILLRKTYVLKVVRRSCLTASEKSPYFDKNPLTEV